jgi:hypothetical protein
VNRPSGTIQKLHVKLASRFFPKRRITLTIGAPHGTPESVRFSTCDAPHHPLVEDRHIHEQPVQFHVLLRRRSDQTVESACR